MNVLGELVRDLQPHSLLTLADQLVYVQSHHHGLFLDQTVSDALGGEGWAVRKQAAFESAHALLEAVFKAKGIEGRERLEVAAELFASMGHGKLVFDVTAEGGMVRGDGLHHGASFVEKYGKIVRHKHAVDSFGAGFSAAAASLAFPSDWGHFEAEEVACVAKGDSGCAFSLSRRPERPRVGVAVTRQVVSSLPLKAPPLDAPNSQYPHAIPTAMRVTRNLSAGAEGGLQAFGSRLAIVPVSYVNQITYDTMHLLENRTPELVPVYAALVREAAHAGAFHLLGGILSSPEWAISSKATGDVEHRLEKLLAIARVLGWGRWYSVEFFPGAIPRRAEPRHDGKHLLRDALWCVRPEPPLLPARRGARRDAAPPPHRFRRQSAHLGRVVRVALQERPALPRRGNALAIARRRRVRNRGRSAERAVAGEKGRRPFTPQGAVPLDPSIGSPKGRPNRVMGWQARCRA